ncbi:MAG: Cys-Gln thioester bond-forming surface protein [Bacilli bacterium]|nr:Cys-Gln thioester bond-forming surface protein [Bacilli bacterium]
MKKKLKCLLLLFGLLALCPSIQVKAQTYQETFNDKYKWIPDTFINKEKGSTKKYQQLAVITRKSDNQFVYCIEPGTPLDSNEIYTGQDYDQAYVANMTQSQWRRIQLLAYYGYGYSDSEVNHTDLKWYSVTQFMIWQTVPHGYDIYFADSLNGNRISKYTSEMAEMEALLSKHYATPDFGATNFETVIGQTLKLTDNSGVLSKYEVTSNSFISSSKSGNDLYLTATAVGNTNISLTKKDVKYSHPTIVYVKSGTQDVVQVGSYDPIDTKINVNILGGKITAEKLDSKTLSYKPLGDAKLTGAVYGVYNENDVRVGQVSIGNNNTGTSDYLPSLGRFYLKEEISGKGYQLDTTMYWFELTKDNLYPTLKVFEDVIEVDVELFKVFANGQTGILTGEPNIEFEFYLISSGELYTTGKTNEKGKLKVTLPYGKWRVHQKNTSLNHEKVDDFEITVNENTENPYYQLLSNAPITAKLKVLKIDKDSQKVIIREGLKFKIKNLDTNEYVKQTITYPTAQTIEVFEMDKNGVIITPYALSCGRYQLEEVEDQQIEGYLWNSEPLIFEIGENSKFTEDEQYGTLLELKFANEQVKGELNVNKVGEKVIIEDGSFRYEEIKLDGVHYELYADEDIYSQDGTLIYKKNDLVKDFYTKNGFYKVTGLYLGKYCLKEKASVGNHVVDESSYCFELKYKDQYTKTVTYTLNLKNYLKKSDFEFTKVDVSTGKPLPNTTITIYTNNEGEERQLIFTGKTDEFGKIIIKGLFTSKFVMFESEAPEGYILNTEPMEFEITEDGQVVKSTMTNEKIKSTIKIHKVDENNNPLAGVLIGIFDLENNLLGKYYTNESGDIEFVSEYGKFYYQELETVEGFILNDEKVYFSVTENGAIIESTLVNYSVPNTGIDRIDLSYILGGLAILSGTGIIIYAKKKKQK